MKFNFKKGTNLFRYGFYKIVADNGDELILPIKTVKATLLSQVMQNIGKGKKLTTKLIPLNQRDREELEALGFEIPKGTMQQRIIDTTSDKYKTEISNKLEIYKAMLPYAIYIDLDYVYENKKPLWKNIGLSSNQDYLGLCEFLDEIGMDSMMINRLQEYISLVHVAGANNYKEAEEKMVQSDVFFSEMPDLEENEDK